MQVLQIISVAILLIAACLAAVILIRKIPQLSLIDIEAEVKPKEKVVEERILRERLKRKLDEARSRVRWIEKMFGTITLRLREWWGKLEMLERKLGILHGGMKKKEASMDALFAEAEANVESDPKRSERVYLEIIKTDPKNVHAYSGIAELYISERQWVEAKGTLEFLMKVDTTKTDRYAFRLAEIAREEGSLEEAMEFAWRAVEVGGNEPRYLDFFIEMSILCKHRRNAERGLRMLQEANPENAKIPEFEARTLAL